MALEVAEINKILKKNSKAKKFPKHTQIFSDMEYILICQILSWASDSINPFEIKEFINTLPFDKKMVKFLSKVVGSLEKRDFETFPKIDTHTLKDDIYGTWLQTSLSNHIRKELAANYTQDSNEIISKIPLDREKIHRVIDPFAGSGRLLTAYLASLDVKDLALIELIHINEIMPTAAVIAYARHRLQFPSIPLKVTTKNGFEIKGKYDLVIMNPPFTRSHNIPDKIRPSLLKLASSYDDDYKQGGLHIWAIYLADQLLNSHGVVLSVLPAAAIMSRYSQNIKNFLLDNYSKLNLWTFQRTKAYSEGSSLKELLLQAGKGEGDTLVNFTTLEPSLEDLRSYEIEASKLRETWNWTALYSRPELINFATTLQDDLGLVTAEFHNLEIIRGIELYGPNFFFFPNKFWNINYPMVYNDEYRFHFKHSKLIPVLRKPGLYKNRISPSITQYCLVVQEYDDDLLNYANVNQSQAKVAVRRFGERWIHHTRDQIVMKNPVGHLFIVDKLDLASSSILCHFTERSYLCTKNFYVLKTDTKKAKLLSAWFNSSLYLALYMINRREIGGTYGRMQIIDYFNQKLFLPDLNKIDTPQVNEAFNKLVNVELPYLDHQIAEETKRELDHAILNALHHSVDIDLLYMYLNAEFEELKIRS